MDLVKEAGVDVSGWADMKGGAENAAWNPSFCYEWGFLQPGKVAVFNLWHTELSEENGRIFRKINIRKVLRTAGFQDNPTRKRRAQRMDETFQAAWKQKLPVRIIVCERALIDSEQERRSKVSKRYLDPCEWRIE